MKIKFIVLGLLICGCSKAPQKDKTYWITQFPSGRVWETHNYHVYEGVLWFTDERNKGIGIGVASSRIQEIDESDYTVHGTYPDFDQAKKNINYESKTRVFWIQQKDSEGVKIMSRPKFQD